RFVEVARLEPALDPVRIHLDAEDRRARHRPGERLRARPPPHGRGAGGGGAAPPAPPRPAVRMVRPRRSDEPKCFSPAAANVWYVPCRIPWLPMKIQLRAVICPNLLRPSSSGRRNASPVAHPG